MSEDECHIQPTALFPDGANCCPTVPLVTHFVDSEVGRLGTVLLHRPGRELARLTPRNNDTLLFDAIPWVGRAQEEHDAFAAALRGRGVEVLYLSQLLAETLALDEARAELTAGVLADPRLGDTLRRRVGDALTYLDPVGLAGVLIGGLAHEELRTSWERPGGLVYTLMDQHDFIIDPLPNLLFTRDSSVWIRDRAAVTSLAMPARRRETTLVNTIYRHHPRFAGTAFAYAPSLESVEGGDVLLLAPGRAGRGRRGADDAGRRRAAGPAGVRGVAGPHDPGGADRPGAGDDAPGHDRDHGRRRRGDHVRERRRLADGLHGGRRARTASPRSTARRRSCGPPRTRWTSTRCG